MQYQTHDDGGLPSSLVRETFTVNGNPSSPSGRVLMRQREKEGESEGEGGRV